VAKSSIGGTVLRSGSATTIVEAPMKVHNTIAHFESLTTEGEYLVSFSHESS
jgi:hypothetical protein